MITREVFGRTADGRTVELYALRNRAGMEARVATYGAILASLTAPDSRGVYEDVVLGFDTLEGYVHERAYLGATIGRYANRIANGQFELNGATYSLAKNDGPNALHGGVKAFHKVIWNVQHAEMISDGARLTLSYTSPHAEEGYPGTLAAAASFTLTDHDELRIEFNAVTDRDTVVNLTNHSYFNLKASGDILGHVISIEAEKFTPVDATLIPTGELRAVGGTPFDFVAPRAIGVSIDAADEQLRMGRGYDHNWVIEKLPSELSVHASAYEPVTGRMLQVLSTAPGLQFYSGNLLDGTIRGKKGQAYAQRSGFCMEPQLFPDSPNKPTFPSALLRPGEVYRHTIVYRFSAR